MASIGEIIRIKRKELGMTQAELGEKLNISDRAVSKWEQGEGDPNLSIIPDIAKVLGLSLDYLLLGKEEEKITLDDMDAAKRLTYLIKRDDLEMFNKYEYLDGDLIFVGGLKSIKAVNPISWKEMVSFKANKIFSLCCDKFISENYAFSRCNVLLPIIDDFIKMCIDIDRVDVLENIGAKYYDIGHSDTGWQVIFINPDRRVVKDAFKMDIGTLEHFFVQAEQSPKCFEYITNLQLKIDKFKTKNDLGYVCTFLQDAILKFAVKYEKYEVLDRFLEVYKQELNNCYELIKKNDEQYNPLFRQYNYSQLYNMYGSYCCTITSNPMYNQTTYHIVGRCFAVEEELIEAALLKSRFDIANKLNDYNKLVAEKGFYQKKIFNANEMERFVKLNSDISDKEKTKIRCIDRGILVAEEASKIRDLKLLKEILAESIYNPFEVAYQYYKSKDWKSLYKMMIDYGQENCAKALLSGEADSVRSAKSSFLNYLLEQPNAVGENVKHSIGSETSKFDFGFEGQVHRDYHNGYVKSAPFEWYCKRDEYYFEKINDYCRDAKQEVYNIMKRKLDAEKAQIQYEKDKINALKKHDKKYFEDLLATGQEKDQRIYIIDLCSLFDAILKYDYECEGDELFDRMESYYKKHVPQTQWLDDGWGEEYEDMDYENNVIKPWKRTWELMSRLRQMRNNTTHPEKNDVIELNGNELKECLDFVFSIKKVD